MSSKNKNIYKDQVKFTPIENSTLRRFNVDMDFNNSNKNLKHVVLVNVLGIYEGERINVKKNI